MKHFRLSMLGRQSIYELLEAGCKIKLPDGRWLQGEPCTRYIHIGYNCENLGAYDMSLDGLKRALEDTDLKACVQEED